MLCMSKRIGGDKTCLFEQALCMFIPFQHKCNLYIEKKFQQQLKNALNEIYRTSVSVTLLLIMQYLQR